MPQVWESTFNGGEGTNILWNLVYAARASNLHTVFVDGIPVAGQGTQLSEAKALAEIQAQTEDLLRRRDPFKATLTPVVG
ncbi:MAG: hypothetical protein Q6K80_10920 [Thermostichus sp. DG_1_6_bins_120]|uniref:hypothetical protein n=1 Tax=uncultured Thermosynechococcus sp. TaxID=436945 RepID=UPI00260AF5B4|nr:hypothetical protein [uncultured Thermosynechococcus sp.]